MSSIATPDDILAFQLHRLASTYGMLLHLDDAHRKDVASRARLDSYFGHTSLVPKFVRVAQAVSTLFTPTKGQANFAVMFGFTTHETHIFYCKNGGGQDPAIRSHFRAVWTILQQIRQIENPTLHADLSTPSPDRKPPQASDDLLSKLGDLAYAFVANKALDRAKKRKISINALFALLEALPKEAFEKKTVRLMRIAANSATDAAKLRGEGQNDAVPWEVFRQSTLGLKKQASARTVNESAMENLRKLSNELPDGLSFGFEKCLDKMLKVETAVLTLHDLAVSPRRSHIVQKTLVTHPVALPAKTTTKISFSTLEDHFPPNSDIEKIKKKMCDAGTSSSVKEVSVHSKVHSECQLVAWVAQNLNNVAPDVSLVPYVTCSKLHCFACFLWLQEFNRLNDLTLPHIAFDGCHGGLQPGWLPPSLKPDLQKNILLAISSRLKEAFDTHKHQKESSASTTSSDEPRSPRDLTETEDANITSYEVTIPTS